MSNTRYSNNSNGKQEKIFFVQQFDDFQAGQVLMWPKETRGVILGSFYWGYALTQVLSSLVVRLLGARRLLGLLIFVSSTATLLIPIFSQFNSWLVIFLRILAGVAQV